MKKLFSVSTIALTILSSPLFATDQNNADPDTARTLTTPPATIPDALIQGLEGLQTSLASDKNKFSYDCTTPGFTVYVRHERFKDPAS